jgi:hypothetical protein
MIILTCQQWLSSPTSSDPDVVPPFPLTGDIECGLVRYSEESDSFNIYEQQGRTQYKIEAVRILSAAAFVDWMWQLHSKEWFTGQHAKDLMDCLCCYIYREHNGQFPQDFYQITNAINEDPDGRKGGDHPDE